MKCFNKKFIKYKVAKMLKNVIRNLMSKCKKCLLRLISCECNTVCAKDIV